MIYSHNIPMIFSLYPYCVLIISQPKKIPQEIPIAIPSWSRIPILVLFTSFETSWTSHLNPTKPAELPWGSAFWRSRDRGWEADTKTCGFLKVAATVRWWARGRGWFHGWFWHMNYERPLCPSFFSIHINYAIWWTMEYGFNQYAPCLKVVGFMGMWKLYRPPLTVISFTHRT